MLSTSGKAGGLASGDVHEFAKNVEKATGFESRATILGHLQRGGIPTAMDRVTGSVLGYKAVELLMNKESGKMVYFLDNHVYTKDLKEVVTKREIDYKDLYKINEIIG